ncbi:hypothetical protein BX600DRAFT_448394 [Xylariales sp. PMI_506]|nr:hypothetical protein BX600DRAFT_448394 [Xylariales sp. PMI_506]
MPQRDHMDVQKQVQIPETVDVQVHNHIPVFTQQSYESYMHTMQPSHHMSMQAQDIYAVQYSQPSPIAPQVWEEQYLQLLLLFSKMHIQSQEDTQEILAIQQNQSTLAIYQPLPEQLHIQEQVMAEQPMQANIEAQPAQHFESTPIVTCEPQEQKIWLESQDHSLETQETPSIDETCSPQDDVLVIQPPESAAVYTQKREGQTVLLESQQHITQTHEAVAAAEEPSSSVVEHDMPADVSCQEGEDLGLPPPLQEIIDGAVEQNGGEPMTPINPVTEAQLEPKLSEEELAFVRECEELMEREASPTELAEAGEVLPTPTTATSLGQRPLSSPSSTGVKDGARFRGFRRLGLGGRRPKPKNAGAALVAAIPTTTTTTVGNSTNATGCSTSSATITEPASNEQEATTLFVDSFEKRIDQNRKEAVSMARGGGAAGNPGGNRDDPASIAYLRDKGEAKGKAIADVLASRCILPPKSRKAKQEKAKRDKERQEKVKRDDVDLAVAAAAQHEMLLAPKAADMGDGEKPASASSSCPSSSSTAAAVAAGAGAGAEAPSAPQAYNPGASTMSTGSLDDIDPGFSAVMSSGFMLTPATRKSRSNV